MPLGPELLLELVKTDKLVENLDEREIANPEGAGFDLRVGEIYQITEGAYLGIKERRVAELELLAKYKPDEKEQIFILKPGEVYIIKTLEKVNLPLSLTAGITLRRTGYSGGLILSEGNVAPGYKGELSMGIFNASKHDFKLALGSRLLFITFQEVQGEGTQYRGQWQNNDMLRKGTETQV